MTQTATRRTSVTIASACRGGQRRGGHSDRVEGRVQRVSREDASGHVTYHREPEAEQEDEREALDEAVYGRKCRRRPDDRDHAPERPEEAEAETAEQQLLDE